MITRLFLVTSVAASLAVAAAGARAQGALATTPAVSPHKCVKPEQPGNKFAADIKAQDEAAKN
jgi:hypothetical protein